MESPENTAFGDDGGFKSRIEALNARVAAAARVLADRGITPTVTAMTIAVAAKASGPLSQSELADRLAVEGATMVAMVDRLVKAGLVIREPSTTDRRVKRVVLTQAGNLMYDKVRAEAAAFRRELLAHTDPKKLLVATELLEGLQGILDSVP